MLRAVLPKGVIPRAAGQWVWLETAVPPVFGKEIPPLPAGSVLLYVLPRRDHSLTFTGKEV